jgi:UDP-N-acetylmuramoyl-tripeptide--D-alanyl-D-alanine ligase
MAGELASSNFNLVVKALFPAGWLYLKSQLVGDYNFENLMAAACVGKYFEVDPLRIQESLANYVPSNNRSQLIKGNRNTIIMDAYNANPTSMIASLANFSQLVHPEKYLILGDMLELGEQTMDEHQKIVDYVDSLEFKEVFLVGPLFLHSKSRHKKKKFEHVELLSTYLKTQPIDNKLILIKGSRGIRLEKILDLLV